MELTKEQIEKLDWAGGEKFALVNTETQSIFFGAETREGCQHVYDIMDKESVIYPKLKLYPRYESDNNSAK